MKKATIPEELKEFDQKMQGETCFGKMMQAIADLRGCPVESIKISSGYRSPYMSSAYYDFYSYYSNGKDFKLEPQKENGVHGRHEVFPVYTRKYTSLFYVDDSGNVWKSKLSLKIIGGSYGNLEDSIYKGSSVSGVKIPRSVDCVIDSYDEWKTTNKLEFEAYAYFIQGNPIDILEKQNEYASKYAQKLCLDLSSDINVDTVAECMLMAPQIEQLGKAGYAIVNGLFHSLERYNPNSTVGCFNRLTRKGSSIKDIFKTEKCVYQTLKDESNLMEWDIYRKLAKEGRISKETIKDIYEMSYRSDQIEHCRKILKKCYKEKPIFTWHSLQNYLQRVDMYEAIGTDEALMLLDDYLLSCEQLEMFPKIDGDSLKREHDIAARLVRQRRNEILKKQMDKACAGLCFDNYENDEFSIQAIDNYDDLIDEATQQHNCVASYAQNIIDGKSRIYSLRRKAFPKKSYITVELSPDGKKIRQAYLAYNRPPRSQAVTDFLGEWLKFLAI